MIDDDMKDTGRTMCPLEDLLEILSRKWSLLIIAVIGNRGSARFNEILRSLNGITPKVLARRLKELEEMGLIERRVYPDKPPRVEYVLTSDGIELREAVKPLLKWVVKRSRRKYSGSPCLRDLV